MWPIILFSFQVSLLNKFLGMGLICLVLFIMIRSTYCVYQILIVAIMLMADSLSKETPPLYLIVLLIIRETPAPSVTTLVRQREWSHQRETTVVLLE